MRKTENKLTGKQEEEKEEEEEEISRMQCERQMTIGVSRRHYQFFVSLILSPYITLRD